MIKCLLLFSGGLDSILAAKILEKQKIKIIPICFQSYFFNCNLAKRSAKSLGLKLKVVDFSKEHLQIVKSPKYGRGKGMNPCLDCRLLMLKTAKQFAKLRRNKFNLLATGEVLGERPFSQNINALKLIEKEANLKGLILRPLSAKVLPETIYEKKGIVKREQLFNISGKSRKSQLSLVKKFKIKEFPQPASGCILTDSEYSKKLRELFRKVPDCNGNDCQILRKGRVFWQGKVLFIVARNEKECYELKKLGKKKDLILEPKNFPGPTVLIRSFSRKMEKNILEKARNLLLKYSKKIPKNPEINVI
ncbi:MAG: tRNA 4-thiouridine(8) synthase ThiI [Patescibacteria group bacterium]|nr:tRNA 4-thiouridine(8) synthase ThiI [Patescibacteria group bacterium]